MHTYKKYYLLPTLLYMTNTRISSFRVSDKYILSIIKSLDSTKSHRVSYDTLENDICGIIKKVIFLYLKKKTKP